MMRGIADGRLEVTKTFAEEMYFCLGCLACETACPAGVDYTTLFEHARAEIERAGVLATPGRSRIRAWTLNRLFVNPKRLRFLGRLLRLYQKSGLQTLVRKSRLLNLLPGLLRELEPLTPTVENAFTQERFDPATNPSRPRYRVGLLAGCVQDIAFSSVNADTICVLQENGCEVVLPEAQVCCGSLHAHNGETDTARALARRNIDAFEVESLDAIIVNAGGCGSHLKHIHHVLADDPAYADQAIAWAKKVQDVHEFLVRIGFRAPAANPGVDRVTYHASCHLAHGQKINTQPRAVLQAIPGLTLVELPEAEWCCGSAGIYNITQPEMSMKLLDRKMGHIQGTQAQAVATANPGCLIQLAHGSKRCKVPVSVKHPISLLADAYRAES